MPKFKTIDVWNELIGNKETVVDYAGREIKKSACGNPNSKYYPTIDHIRPISDGGSDARDNLVICHRDTNEEKADNFPHWKANGRAFKAIRVKGSKIAYRIVND